jgi:hypothetical protein
VGACSCLLGAPVLDRRQLSVSLERFAPGVVGGELGGLLEHVGGDFQGGDQLGSQLVRVGVGTRKLGWRAGYRAASVDQGELPACGVSCSLGACARARGGMCATEPFGPIGDAFRNRGRLRQGPCGVR